MKVQEIEIEKLKPYDKNPRLNDKAVEKVARSIREFGFNQPIVCNQDNTICVGHTRWKAAKELGLKTVPVFKKEMSEEQFIAYNIADNRVSELSKWDEKLLSDLMMELNDLDDSMLESVGFTDAEIEALLDDDESMEELVGSLDEKKPVHGKDATPIEKSHIRMVQIYLTDENIDSFMDKCNDLSKIYETKTLTDTITTAIDREAHASF